MMKRSEISPDILQEMLESAANAAAKGQSQFFTPVKFGREVCAALPRLRKTIVDFNCGNGQLLLAAANDSTMYRLGADIEPPRTERDGIDFRITGDVTRLYPLLVETEWEANLFVLNPPWDLHWYRDRLAGLAESSVAAVRRAFEATDPRLNAEHIDSTVASLMIALDRCPLYGEGVLIANNATLERLIFAENAPHHDLAAHIWARVVVPGNPMTGLDDHHFSNDGSFQTGVIYFARDHRHGPRTATSLAEAADRRWEWRRGAKIEVEHQYCENPAGVWKGVGEEHDLRMNRARPKFHLSLTSDGHIHVYLSIFERNSVKVDKALAASLNQLAGKRPLQLVLQRAERKALHAAAFGGVWRVDPELQTAVKAALAEYERERAPLYELSPIMRLGYLDEEDFITCLRDLHHPETGALLCAKGQRYEVCPQLVTRHSSLAT